MLGVLSAIKDVATGVGPFNPKPMVFAVEKAGGGFATGSYPHMLNPVDYKLNRKVDWACVSSKDEKGGSTQYYTFKSGNDTLNFTVVLDCSEEGESVSLLKEIEGLYDLTYAYTKGYNKTNDQPDMRAQLVKVAWGGFKFTGVVNSLDVTVTLMDPQGRPKRATVAISMQGEAFVHTDAETFFQKKDGGTKRKEVYPDLLKDGSLADPTAASGVAGALAKLGI